MSGEEFGFGQSPPISTELPSAHDLVIADMERRKAFGLAKYGTTLTADNGRDHLQDAYEEVLDLAVYLKCEMERRRCPQVVNKLSTGEG